MRRHLFPPSPLQLWAADETSVQVTWGALSAGQVALEARSDGVRLGTATCDHLGGPGALSVSDLPADTQLDLVVTFADGTTSISARTLPAPPGIRLSRFATISDLHLGSHRFGFLRTMRDRSDHALPHPLRCAVAAAREAVAWGAELIIIKGDAANHEREPCFEQLSYLIDLIPPTVEVLLLPGNHDVDGGGSRIPLSVGEREVPYIRRAAAVDLEGIRIIGTDTTIPGHGRGTTDRISSPVTELIEEGHRPAFVALHHQLQPNTLPRLWPPGVPRSEARRFIRALSETSQPVLVSSGHTHRNRRREQSGVMLTQVGSTKDWPGVWAGYSTYQGGIVQTVRRVAEPSAIGWVEYSRGALLGGWSAWAPGSLEARTFRHVWPRPDAASQSSGVIRAANR